eukprot:6193910-Pleurochrysis_carterae.AAC.1
MDAGDARWQLALERVPNIHQPVGSNKCALYRTSYPYQSLIVRTRSETKICMPLAELITLPVLAMLSRDLTLVRPPATIYLPFNGNTCPYYSKCRVRC